jgi:hypothetical protein
MAIPVTTRTHLVDAIRRVLSPKYTVAPTEVAIGAATTRSAQLTAGTYLLRADVDCYVLQGSVTVDATTSSVRLPADEVLLMDVGETAGTDDYVSVIQDSASGTLQITAI